MHGGGICILTCEGATRSTATLSDTARTVFWSTRQQDYLTSTAMGRTYFAILAKAKDPETGLPLRNRELGGESATLIVAGTDTTFTAMAACFFYLSRNRAAYDRLANEIRSTFPSPEENRMGPLTSKCTFLRACIDESMRLSPSAASSLWRETGSLGATVDGQYLPPGVDASTCIYSIHHNPAYYPDPLRLNLSAGSRTIKYVAATDRKESTPGRRRLLWNGTSTVKGIVARPRRRAIGLPTESRWLSVLWMKAFISPAEDGFNEPDAIASVRVERVDSPRS
ncbi:cytochrome P450 [Aspergillus tetrazonus]